MKDDDNSTPSPDSTSSERVTRRDIIGSLGLLGAGTLLAASGAKASGLGDAAMVASNINTATTAGAPVNVMSFGAKGDGVTDDSQAIQAADAYAAARGGSVYLPGTAKGYLIKSALTMNCRHVYGDASFSDGNDRGTLILFRPDSIVDLEAAMTFPGQNGALVEHLGISGPHNYTVDRLASDGIVNPSLLPHYSAFSAGVAAFATDKGGAVTFRNCRTNNTVKVGLLLKGQQGHVSTYDCSWVGLFGVYCLINGEDYAFYGGGISGVWSGVLLGDKVYVQHGGGFTGILVRVHLGWGPHAFYQVRNNDTDTPHSLGLISTLIACSFEQIGEAAIKLLDNSNSDLRLFRCIHESWSTKLILPDSIIPAGQKQQYYFWLGEMQTLVVDGNICPSGSGVPRSHINQTGQAARIVKLMPECDVGEFADAFSVTGFTVLSKALGRRAQTVPAYDDHMYKSDRAIAQDVRTRRNLLLSPESFGGSLGTSGNCQAGSGGNWKVSGGSATIDTLSGWQSKRALQVADGTDYRFWQELGENPMIVRLQADGGGMGSRLLCEINPSVAAHRRIAFSFWFANASCRARVDCGGNGFLYDLTVNPQGPGLFTKYVAVGDRDMSNPGYLGVEIIVPKGGEPLYIAGVMLSFDDLAPYNPYSVPSIDGGLALSSMPVSPPAPLPGQPAGYIDVIINGVNRRMPYY